MLRPSIGIDWDDVTAPFNSIAIRMANEKYHPEKPYRQEVICLLYTSDAADE